MCLQGLKLTVLSPLCRYIQTGTDNLAHSDAPGRNQINAYTGHVRSFDRKNYYPRAEKVWQQQLTMAFGVRGRR